MQDTFCALQTDQARADNQYILVLLIAQQASQTVSIVERHERGLCFNGIQTLHRRDKRTGTGADCQLVIRDLVTVFQNDSLCVLVNAGDGAAEHCGYIVCFIEIARTIVHLFLGGLAEQEVGDERAAVGEMRLAGNQDDFTVLVDRTDALNRADSGSCIADDNILHFAHLSSNTIAWFGHPATHCGVPSAFLVHSSHFCTAPASEVLMQPYGQERTQV